MKYGFPEAPKEEEMRNKKWQNKYHITKTRLIKYTENFTTKKR